MNLFDNMKSKVAQVRARLLRVNLGSATERLALKGRGFSRADKNRVPISSCHPERSQSIREANGLAESMDLMFCLPLARRCSAIATLVIAILLLSTSAFAASSDARFRDLGHRMMCTCGCGQILLECNHVGCQSSDKMRDQLQAALDKGDNDDLILQGFVQQYGPTVIAAPTAKGFNKVAWIMPFVVLALGIAFVTWIVRAWKNRPEPALADGIAIPKGPELDRFRAQARKETDV
jgi:cytochrome c-type biogenesis protein CcmH/NrfF